MTSDQDADGDEAAERAKKQAVVLTAIRAAGAIFLLAGTAVAGNLGGVATALNIEPVKYVIGGGLIVVGLSDIFLMPVILANSFAAARKKEAEREQSDSGRDAT